MPTRSCLNLRQLLGHRFRVTFEESYHADLGRGVNRGDPWLQIIVCCDRRGHFFPWSEKEVAVSVDKPKVVDRVVALGCCRMVQDSDDDGATLVFDLADFDRVAEIMKPRKRRRLNPEQRAKNSERLKKLAARRTKRATRAIAAAKKRGRQQATRRRAKRSRRTAARGKPAAKRASKSGSPGSELEAE